MTKNGKLFVGLIVLILLWALMLFFKWDPIEKDISSRVNQALTSAGFPWADAVTDDTGRDVYLKGLARNSGDGESAEAVAKEIYGVGDVDSSGIEIRPYKPASITANLIDGRLVLSGTMQNEVAAANIAKQFGESLEVEIDNRIFIDQEVAQPGWQNTLGTTAKDFVSIEELSLSLDNDALTLSGVSRSEAIHQYAIQSASQLESVANVDTTNLIVKPFARPKFGLTKTDAGLTLTGSLNSEAEADALRMLVAATVDTPVIDEVQISRDTGTAAWLPELEPMASYIGGIEHSSYGLSAGTLSLSGVVRSQEQFDDIAVQAGKIGSIDDLDLSGLEIKPYSQPWIEIQNSSDGLAVLGVTNNAVLAQDLVDTINNSKGANRTGSIDNQLVVDENTAPVDWNQPVGALMEKFAMVEQGNLSVRDGNLTLAGIVRTESEYDQVLASLSGSSIASSVNNDNLELRPFKSPRFSIASVGGNVLVSGLIGQQVSAQKLVQGTDMVFEAGDSRQIVIDPDVTEAPWVDDVLRLMPSMTGLESGNLQVEDDAINLSGVARTQEAYELISNAVSESSNRNITNNIALRPWQQPTMDISTESNRLEVVGMMPDKASIDLIESHLGGLGSQLNLPKESVMAVGEDVQHTEWLSSLTGVIPELAVLRKPGLRVADGVVTLNGVATTRENFNRVGALVGQAATGLKFNNKLEFRDIAAEQAAEKAAADKLAAEQAVAAKAAAEKLAAEQAAAKAAADKLAAEQAAAKAAADKLAAEQAAAKAAADKLAAEQAAAKAAADKLAAEQAAAKVAADNLAADNLAAEQAVAEKAAADKLAAEQAAAAMVAADNLAEEQAAAAKAAADKLAAEQAAAKAAADKLAAEQAAAKAAAEKAAAEILAAEQAAAAKAAAEQLEAEQAAGKAAAAKAEAARLAARCDQDIGELMTGKNIEFAFGSADLSPNSFSLLDNLVGILQECSGSNIEVSGHTDNIGSDQANIALSGRRASSVVGYLLAAGVPESRLLSVGYGSAQPIGDNNTEVGRAANRRIEFNIKTIEVTN